MGKYASTKETIKKKEKITKNIPRDEIMPITKSGRKVKRSMVKQYGKKKGKQVFYASINKGKAGSKKWHKKRKH